MQRVKAGHEKVEDEEHLHVIGVGGVALEGVAGHLVMHPVRVILDALEARNVTPNTRVIRRKNTVVLLWFVLTACTASTMVSEEQISTRVLAVPSQKSIDWLPAFHAAGYAIR